MDRYQNDLKMKPTSKRKEIVDVCKLQSFLSLESLLSSLLMWHQYILWPVVFVTFSFFRRKNCAVNTLIIIIHYIRPWHFQNFEDCFCPRSSMEHWAPGGIGWVTCQVMYKWKQLQIGSRSIVKIDYRQWWSVFCYKLLTSMVRVCHKLAWISEVYMLNLGQI